MKAYFLAVLMVVCEGAAAAVWHADNEWSDEWERKFSVWVEKNWVPEVFSDPSSPYSGIATDCADAVYDMRLIYSYENRLPFVISGSGSSGGRISNKKSTWDHLPQDKRVRKLIDYVNDATSSKSLVRDTYPIALNEKTFKPGVIYIEPGSHAFLVVSMDEYGVPSTLSSTVPKVARELYIERNFPSYVPADTRRFQDGYRRFRWPEHLGLPVESVPGFDDEQYWMARAAGDDFIEFTDRLLRRFGKKREPAPMRVRRFMYNLCYAGRHRAEVITDAEKYRARLRASGRRCMGPGEDYDYSTDSRDKRLKSYFEYVKSLIGSKTWTDSDWRDSEYRKELYLRPYAEAIFRDQGADPSAKRSKEATDDDLIAWCGIEYKPGKNLSLREVWQSIQRGTLSADPNASLEGRWGLLDYPEKTGCRRY